MDRPLPPPLSPARPPWLRVSRRGTTTIAEWRWFTWGRILQFLFALPFVYVGLDWLAGGEKAGMGGAVFLLCGVYLFYTGLAGLVNGTRFTLTPGQLRVDVGPLPWVGGGTWRYADTREVTVAETGYTVNYRHLYRIVGIGRGGASVQVGHAMFEVETARYLQWLIDDYRAEHPAPR